MSEGSSFNVNSLKVTDHSDYVQLRNDMKIITKHKTTVKELLRLTTVCIDFYIYIQPTD